MVFAPLAEASAESTYAQIFPDKMQGENRKSNAKRQKYFSD